VCVIERASPSPDVSFVRNGWSTIDHDCFSLSGTKSIMRSQYPPLASRSATAPPASRAVLGFEILCFLPPKPRNVTLEQIGSDWKAAESLPSNSASATRASFTRSLLSSSQDANPSAWHRILAPSAAKSPDHQPSFTTTIGLSAFTGDFCVSTTEDGPAFLEISGALFLHPASEKMTIDATNMIFTSSPTKTSCQGRVAPFLFYTNRRTGCPIRSAFCAEWVGKHKCQPPTLGHLLRTRPWTCDPNQ